MTLHHRHQMTEEEEEEGSASRSAAAPPNGNDPAEVSAPTTSAFHTIAGVMGNVLEWYDFALFGFFSDIIAEVFFPPKDDGHENLVATYVIFGTAFVMRPVGGLVIGYLGDTKGRKHALTRSLFLMAIPTTCMGLLPTYEMVGGLAVLLLVVCRVLQGISVGGQLPASLVYTVEQRHPSTWGYYGSLPMTAANCGTLLGNLCGAFLRDVMTRDQLVRFGWRLPFFSGILIAVVACYLERHGSDGIEYSGTATNEHGESNGGGAGGASTEDDPAPFVTAKHTDNPIRIALRRENRVALLSTTLASMLWGAGFYISFIWMAIYMETLLDPAVPGAFWINAGALLLGMTFVLPMAGHLSDKIGRVKVMAVAALLLGILGPVMVVIIAQRKTFWAFLAQLTLGLLLSLYGGPLCAWLVENYSPEVRLTSASLGYDIAHATASGFSPAMATRLFGHGETVPGFLYTMYAAIALVGLYLPLCCYGSLNRYDGNSSDQVELPVVQQPSDKSDKDLPEVS